jgi:type II secretory pathway component PulM
MEEKDKPILDEPVEPETPENEKKEFQAETGTPRDDTDARDPNPYETGVFKAVVAKERKKSAVLIVVVALLAAVLLAMAYFLFFKGEPGPKTSDQIRQMQQLAQKVEGMESDVKQKQDEIFNLMDEYKTKTGQDSMGINALELSEDEQKLMQRRIDEEKDLSVKSLLEDILEKNNEIRELKIRIAEIEELLPKPHIVSAGENHYQIAMDFLVNEKKVDKKRAMELVERTALLETMVPGFKVWNFYAEDEYGSSVTQGTAAISPNSLIRQAKKKLVDARDQAISQRDKLAEDINTLEEKRTQIIEQLDLLTMEKSNLINKVSNLNQQNQKMQQTVNSLFYLADTQRRLKEKNILKGGFLRSTKLQDVVPEHFTMSIDLREAAQVLIAASDLGIDKIRSVSLYPRFYKKETDYDITISQDRQIATVMLLKVDKFKNERVVLAVK